jgi:hypothetical protein
MGVKVKGNKPIYDIGKSVCGLKLISHIFNELYMSFEVDFA